MNQLDLHKKIDRYLQKGPKIAIEEDVRSLIDANFDARNYLFSTAGDEWIDWLWERGLLDVIKQSTEDKTRFSYQTPELDYLVRMTEKAPEKVTAIMLQVPISKDAFNPEVIDRFLWIAGSLPAEQLKSLATKIRDEQWVALMHTFNRSGYIFERIIKKLIDAKDGESILSIAEALLIVRTKEEIAEKSNGIMADNPFYIDDIGHSEVFAALASVDDAYAERVLTLTTRIIAKIVETSNRESGEEVFKFSDAFYLFDVDFFALDVNEERHMSYRDDVRDLAAVVKLMLQKTIGKTCDDSQELKRLFNTYVETLPDSRSMWRLRLYALSLCPSSFKSELKNAFFRLFTTERYHEIDGGTEYKKTLKIAFGVLSGEEKRDYVSRILEYFNKKSKENPDQNWHKRHGWEILSSICDYLTDEEKGLCEKYFGRKCDSKFVPEPDIGQVRSGFVEHKSPVNLAEYSVDDIIVKLSTEWSPSVLKEKYGQDDFLQPRGTEGLAEGLKSDLKKRTEEYIKNAPRFFDREKINSHYTYSYLRGIEGMLRDGSIPSDTDFSPVFALFDAIRISGSEAPLERGDSKSWLARWVDVHDGVADILLQLLTEKYEQFLNFDVYREQIFNIIRYLFTFDDPIPEHEKPEYGDLFHIAINSVRGRAFQVLTQFIFYDGKKFTKNAEVKIKEDVKKLYEWLVDNETSMAVRFIIGHYIGPFYFRDKKWFESQWQNIFPVAPEKKDFYLATWEGYSNSTLYGDLFKELRNYYDRAIDLVESDYPERKYTKPLDELLAVHMALAFAHFKEFDFNDSLFQKFWNTPNIKRHEEFVAFLGRHCLSRDSEWLNENKVSKEKLMNFWDWLLKKEGVDPEVFSGFGFWVHQSSEVLDFKWLAARMAATMKRAGGQIDWDYGLMQQLPKLAEISPKQSFKIIEYYLLHEDKPNTHRTGWIHVDRELRQALDILYANPETKDHVYNLINRLVEVGGAQFWGLKAVIKEEP